MDAAVTLQQKKTIKFFYIVDFPLSKQGIFFITLTHKPVIVILSQAFSLVRSIPSSTGSLYVDCRRCCLPCKLRGGMVY